MKLALNFNSSVEKDDCMRIDLPNNLLSMRKHEKDGCDHGQKVRTTHFYFFFFCYTGFASSLAPDMPSLNSALGIFGVNMKE